MTVTRQTYIRIAWIGWTFTILFLLLGKGDGGESWYHQIPHYDKVAHFGLFFIWSALAFLSLFESSGRRALVTILLLIAFFAALTEVLQLMAEGRSADVLDFVADMLGGFSAIYLTKYFILKQ